MFADLAMPVPLDGAFTYAVPAGMTLEPGMAVRAPWGNRVLTGVVLALRESPPEGIAVREIAELAEDQPVLDGVMLELVRWCASYYQAPLGEVMRCALPAGTLREPRRAPRRKDAPSAFPARPRVERLNSSQQRALAALDDAADRRPILLHGVTGSGKTAVYLAAIEAALARGVSSLLLVPEIGLTPAVFADFAAALGSEVAILHSSLAPGERARQWRRLRRGEARVAIGTRSAVFAPLPRLGLIVVDEEHDASYKQQEAPRYHGRDLAVMRARLAGARIVLGSATPSLESYQHTTSGKYRLLEMSERVAKRPLPTVRIVDMGEDFRRRSALARANTPPGGDTVFSQPLLDALADRLARRQQSLLLLNRRGFAPVVLCRSCGACVQCRDCSLALTFHKRRAQLVCHFCGWARAVPERCPACDSEHVYFLGSGSEKVEEELSARFPLARVARLDRDTARSRRHFDDVLARFRAGELDILVGTQMIAKGHDVPGVTLVGVLQADLGLTFPDFRAAERTYQLLTQVAGRAGRGAEPGEVLLQAHHAAHYAVEAAARGDYTGFVEKDANFRRWMHYPPFAALAAVQLRHRDENRARALAELARNYFERQSLPATRVLGPAPAPLARAKQEYRFQFLLKSGSRRELAALLHGLRAFARENKFGATALIVDMDPLSL